MVRIPIGLYICALAPILLVACGGPESIPPLTPPLVEEVSLPIDVRDKAQILGIVVEAVNDHRGNLSVTAILGIIAQETGGIGYDNGGDGIMQVTTGAGSCRSRPNPYENTVESIIHNINEGICVLQDQYTRNENNLIYAIWKYNGGENPYDTYSKGLADQDYLGRVASRLECNHSDSWAWVLRDFGLTYCNDGLASQLKKTQELISDRVLPVWPDGPCIKAINCPDLTRPTSIIAAEGEFEKPDEKNRPPGFRAPDNTWWFNAGVWLIPVTDDDPGQMSSGLDASGCYYNIEDTGGRVSLGSRSCNSLFEIRIGPPDDMENFCVSQGLNACTVYVGSRDLSGNESDIDILSARQLNIDYAPPTAR